MLYLKCYLVFKVCIIFHQERKEIQSNFHSSSASRAYQLWCDVFSPSSSYLYLDSFVMVSSWNIIQSELQHNYHEDTSFSSLLKAQCRIDICDYMGLRLSYVYHVFYWSSVHSKKHVQCIWISILLLSNISLVIDMRWIKMTLITK